MTDFRFVFRATLLDVHDGDTVKLALDRGLDGTTTPEWIRLGGPVSSSVLNVYAPELKDLGGVDCMRVAKQWLEARGGAWPFVVETWRTRGDLPKMTLGRYLGHVTDATSGVSLNLTMSDYVRVRGYGGGTGS